MSEINIKQSINTDTVSEDIKTFDDANAPLLENTGIERDGGVTNIYLNTTDYSGLGVREITPDGKVIEVKASSVTDYDQVLVDGTQVGYVSEYGLKEWSIFTGVNDVLLCPDETVVTCQLSDTTITLQHWSLDKVLLESRSINFINLGEVMKLFTSLSIVRWDGLDYSSSFEFNLRFGDQVLILQESNPTISIGFAFQSTSVVGTDAVTSIVLYKGNLVIGSSLGALGSWDGSAWKNFDGSGAGLGPYSNISLVGVGASITAMFVYTYAGVEYLIVGGSTGNISTFDGNTWTRYNSATGFCAGTTITPPLGAVSINAFLQVDSNLIVAGNSGRIGSINKPTQGAWYAYNGTNGIRDNGTVIGTDNIYSLAHYHAPTDENQFGTVLVTGAGGKIGTLRFNFDYYSITTSPADIVGIAQYGFQDVEFKGMKYATCNAPPGAVWQAPKDTGVWTMVTVPGMSTPANKLLLQTADLLVLYNGLNLIFTVDGINWTYRLLPKAFNTNTNIAFEGGRWVASGGGTNPTTALWSYNGYDWSWANPFPGIGVTYSATYVGYVNGYWNFYYYTNYVSRTNDFVNFTVQQIGINGLQRYNDAPITWWRGGTGKIAITTDSINWTITTLPGVTGNVTLLAYNEGVYLFSSDVTPANCVWTTDMVNFTATTIPTFSSSLATILGSISYSSSATAIRSPFNLEIDGMMIAYDWATPEQAGRYARSTDHGKTWTAFSIAGTTGYPVWLGHHFGRWIFAQAYNNINRIYSSTDGYNWSYGTVPGWVAGTNDGVGLMGFYQNTLVIGTYNSGRVPAYSYDGVTWNIGTVNGTVYAPAKEGASWPYSSHYYIKDTWVYSNGNNSVIMSSDGIHWNVYAYPSSTTGALRIFAAGDNWVSIGVNQSTPELRYQFITMKFMGVEKYAYTQGVTRNLPCDNATVLGSNAIRCSVSLDDGRIVVAGDGGRTGFFTGAAWVPYSSATGFSQNGAFLGSENIYHLDTIDGNLVFSGGGGRIGSGNILSGEIYPFDMPGHITNYGNIVGSGDIKAFIEYNNQVLVGGSTGAINSMSFTGSFTPFLGVSGGGVLNSMMGGFSTFGYLYTYKYENGLYLINLVGNLNNISYIFDKTAYSVTIFTGSYALPQLLNGKTRHIITAKNSAARPLFTATKIQATGLIGYTDFINFSSTVVYPDAPYVVSSILNSNATWGYEDITLKLTASATDVYTYTPQFKRDTTSLFQVTQSNTNTLINAYGKLTNNYNQTPTRPFEIRVGLINEVPSFFSVAILDTNPSDTLGVLATNIGSINPLYQPQILNDELVLYQNEKKEFALFKVIKAPPNRVNKVTDTLYKINTISPLNLIDTNAVSLSPFASSVDYNNRMLFSSLIAPGTASKVVSIMNNSYSNSIDTGDKLVTIKPLSSTNIEILGYRIPLVSTPIGSYAIDTYIDDVYGFSTLNNGQELVDSDKTDILYLESTYLSPKIGVTYDNGVILTDNLTIFLKPDSDLYPIGNDIAGSFSNFDLYGQKYLFDGLNIYTVELDRVTGVFNNKTKVASANGLRYIASTPTIIYFLSSFDNSLYTFTGGRALEKFQRLNRKPDILSGTYSPRDNTLVLDTPTSIIWVRDNIVTENIKLPDQTDLKFYDTTSGIVISNNTSQWSYTYDTGDAVVPLSLQTPYFGFNLNQKSILSNWVITIYSEAKQAVTVIGTSYVVDTDDTREQTRKWVINPGDWDEGGYTRVRIQPEYQRSLGTSLKIECQEKILIVSILPEFKEAEVSVISKARSR